MNREFRAFSAFTKWRTNCGTGRGCVRRAAIFALAICLAAPWASADQTQISSYNAAKKKAYGLYVGARPYQAADIYCGLRFKVDPEHPDKRPAEWLSLEHAYPADWMADVFGCENRTDCRRDANETSRTRFNHAEGDLHNLFPALINLNSARGKRLFGEIPGTEKREVTIGTKTFTCDFQREGNVVEPRRIAKGNLARAIFYMCDEYNFPVDPDMLAVLKRWNKSDKPTVFERKRNDLIEQVEGTRNRFIDDPSKADNLQCRAP